jgi:O-antigen biosynthesis protein
MKRVAVIFDNSPRPETTGLYCRRALGKLVRDGLLAEAEHFLPSEIGQIPPGRFDVIPHCTNGSGGRELGSGRMWFVFDEGITRRA